MSVQGEINRIKDAVSDAYSAVSDKGGEIPATQNIANLANAVSSIPTGSDDIFIAEYGVTTYQEILDAYNAGKIVLCRDTNKIYQLNSTYGPAIIFSLSYDDICFNVQCDPDNIWMRIQWALERTAHKTQIISSSSTTSQYPSAKAVYDYAGTKVKTASVTLNTTWTASGDNFTKSVTISGVTANSKIDVQPDAAVIAQLVNDGVTALYFANDNGTVSAVAVGAMPTASMTVQVTITEVTA